MKNQLLKQALNHTLLLFSLALCSNVFAEMYKWIDEDGNTHYSEKAPQGNISPEVIQKESTHNNQSAAKELEKQQQKLSDLREQRHNKNREQNDLEKAKKEKQQQCQQAKERLASYLRPRVNIKDENGELKRATEEQRQAEIKKSEEYINKLCN